MFQEDKLEGLSIHEFTRTRYVTVKTEDNQEKREQREVKFKLLSLYGSSWKWYDDFKDVQHWEQLLEEAEQMGLEYEFARCGEEMDDNETRYSDDADYLLNISRSIDADY